MIPASLLVLLLGNFTLIGLLPLCVFRRDGTFNARWFATSLPFFAMPAVLALVSLGWLQMPRTGRLSALLPLLATLASTASVALLAMTAGTHRVPPALWHQEQDEPAILVTWGPYAHVRHPFYTSFLLAFGAACLACPHPLALLSALYAVVALTITARREERRLCTSGFGAAYRAYSATTGRFLPRCGA